MMETLTATPGKGGTRVQVAKYEAMRRALLKAIPKREKGVAFMELPERVLPHLPKGFAEENSVMWWVTVVKLDLEARGQVQRIPRVSPQHLRRL